MHFFGKSSRTKAGRRGKATGAPGFTPACRFKMLVLGGSDATVLPPYYEVVWVLRAW
jgi:hypothetical protein